MTEAQDRFQASTSIHFASAPARRRRSISSVTCLLLALALSGCERPVTAPGREFVARSFSRSSVVTNSRALIYYGNNSFYGALAVTNYAEGHTYLANTWNSAGVTTTFASSWPSDVATYKVLLLANPQTNLSVAQTADVRQLLANGGTLVLSSEGVAVNAENALLSALGSSMQMGNIRGMVLTTATVTGNTRFAAGLTTGRDMCLYNPATTTGGVNIIEEPAATGVVAAEDIGGGTILLVADADVTSNTAYLWPAWTTACKANLLRLHLNIVEPYLQPADVSPPTVSSIISGTLGLSGWYVSDVRLDWSATDAESGIASSAGCVGSTLTTNTAGIVFICSATNGAGLVATNSVLIKRDASAPVISYAGNAGSYPVNQTVAISCSASDAMSGLASDSCASISGPAYGFGLGEHTYGALATDSAGNAATASTTFYVTVTAASLCELTTSLVTTKGTAVSLCAKLDAIARSIDRGQMSSKNGQIGAFVNEVNAQTGKSSSATNAQTLIALAQAL